MDSQAHKEVTLGVHFINLTSKEEPPLCAKYVEQNVCLCVNSIASMRLW